MRGCWGGSWRFRKVKWAGGGRTGGEGGRWSGSGIWEEGEGTGGGRQPPPTTLLPSPLQLPRWKLPSPSPGASRWGCGWIQWVEGLVCSFGVHTWQCARGLCDSPKATQVARSRVRTGRRSSVVTPGFCSVVSQAMSVLFLVVSPALASCS
jgi:hypothetical protein